MRDAYENRVPQTDNIMQALADQLLLPREGSVFLKQPATTLSIFLDASKSITDPSRLHQEFDMLQLGLLILGLAEHESQNAQIRPLPAYLTYQDEQLAPDSQKLLDIIAFKGCDNIMLSRHGQESNYRCFSDKDAMHRVQIALKIGLYVLNGKLGVNKEALWTNISNSCPALLTIPGVKEFVRGLAISSTYVSPDCLSRLVLNERDRDITEKYFHDALDLCQAAEYSELRQAIQAWMVDSLAKISNTNAETYRRASLAAVSLCKSLDTLDEIAVIKFKKNVDCYKIPSDCFTEVCAQAQAISTQHAQFKAQMEKKRTSITEAMNAALFHIQQNDTTLPLNESEKQYYAYIVVPGLYLSLTEDQLNTEFKMFQIGFLILKLSQHESLIPYIQVQGQSIAPDIQTLQTLSPGFAVDRGDFRHQHSPQYNALQEKAALIMLIGKKVMNGTLVLDKETLLKNIAKVAIVEPALIKLQPVVENSAISYVSSAIADNLITSGHYQIESAFERALAYCTSPNKQALATAIKGLMQATLAEYLNITPNTIASVLKRNDFLLIADRIKQFAQQNDNSVETIHAQFTNDPDIQRIRQQLKQDTNFIFYLDLVIQAFIGLCVGTVIGLALGTTLTGLAVGTVLGMASTRFSLWHAKEYQPKKDLDTQLEACMRVTATM